MARTRSTSPKRSGKTFKKSASKKKEEYEEENEALKEQVEEEEEEEEEAVSEEEGSRIVLSKDLHEPFHEWLEENLLDSSVLHNVIVLQYLQCYLVGIYLIFSAFQDKPEYLFAFVKSSPLVRAISGSFALAQAFSLTAIAQSSYSFMKKGLQYNMFFHLTLALIVIIKKDETIDNIRQGLVLWTVLNFAADLYACYFYKPDGDSSDEEDENDDEEDNDEDDEDDGEQEDDEEDEQ